MNTTLNLLGNAILFSPCGFNAVFHDQMAGVGGKTAMLAEVLPMVEQLAAGLESGGVDTGKVREALALIRNDSSQGNGIQRLLGQVKLGVALERLSPFRKQYIAVADAFSEEHEARIGFSPESAEELRSVFHFIRGREALADQPIYLEKYEELGVVAKGGQADIRLVKLRGEGETAQLYVAWRSLETTAVGRISDYADALKQLDHPHIVKLVEVVRAREGESETIVLILEAAAGESILSHLQNHTEVNAGLLEQVRDQMLEALKYAWRQGLVHRDLKPENVMLAVDAEGRPQVTLLDFALAKFLDGRVSRSSSVGKGSIFYMAPEQLHYGKITEATDIHGMGLVLVDLLRGASRRDTVEEILPAKELKEMRQRYAGDEAMLSLIQQIEWMVHPDPAVRMRVVEKKVWEEAIREGASSVSLIPIDELATESAMAMVDLKPKGFLSRFLFPAYRDFDWGPDSIKGTTGMFLLQCGFGTTALFFSENLGQVVLGLLMIFIGSTIFGSSRLRIVSKENQTALRAIRSMESEEDDALAAAAAKTAMLFYPETTRKHLLIELSQHSIQEPLFSRILSALVALGDDGDGLVRQYLEKGLMRWWVITPEQISLLVQALDQIDSTSAPMRRLLFAEREHPHLYQKIPDTAQNREFLELVINGFGTHPATLEVRRRAIRALQILGEKESS